MLANSIRISAASATQNYKNQKETKNAKVSQPFIFSQVDKLSNQLSKTNNYSNLTYNQQQHKNRYYLVKQQNTYISMAYKNYSFFLGNLLLSKVHNATS